MRLSPALRALAAELTNLPSIGPRQAIRLALYLGSLPSEDRTKIITALKQVEEVHRCIFCNVPHEEQQELCEICSDPKRDHTTLMIVEKETDLFSMEKTQKYNGRYLILGTLPRNGSLSGWQQQQLKHLTAWVKRNSILNEIVLALSPSTGGDQLAQLITPTLQPLTTNITRLGQGLPRGADIEFADEETLGHSLLGRA